MNIIKGTLENTQADADNHFMKILGMSKVDPQKSIDVLCQTNHDPQLVDAFAKLSFALCEQYLFQLNVSS